MSCCTMPMVAAKSAVAAPMTATTASAKGERSNSDVAARDHVDAGGDHGGGVDERGDRRGAFHGVGQPDVERDLRGLAGGADEQQQADGGEEAAVARSGCALTAGRRRCCEVERAEVGDQQEHARAGSRSRRCG